MEKQAYREIASLLQAIENCQEKGNTEWEDKHRERLQSIIDSRFPSGSGFDNGTEFALARSTPDKLVFYAEFHHMNDNGMYSGWSEHYVIVTPSLQHGFNIRINGRNRNEIKEYIEECFSDALLTIV